MNRSAPPHRLLVYRRWLSRYRVSSLLIAAGLFAVWWVAPAQAARFPFLAPPRDTWALVGSIAAGLVFVFTLVAPRLAYVQCRPSHFRVQTPLFSLAISYARIKNIRPVDLAQMHSPRRLKWDERRLLEPFFGHAAVGVDLFGFPMADWLMRTFVNRFMLLRDQPGFLFIVQDWMRLSREMETYRNAWRDRHAVRPERPEAALFRQ